MLVSQLSAATGTSIPTIKHYLREQLLQPPTLVSATRGEYGEEHVQRLLLVKALTDVAGLPLARVREIVRMLEAPRSAMAELLASATSQPLEEDAPRSWALMDQLGWELPRDVGAFAELERALEALDAAGVPPDERLLSELAAGADRIALAEISGMNPDPQLAVRQAVLGSALGGPLILALRRVAHARHTIARHGPRRPQGEASAAAD